METSTSYKKSWEDNEEESDSESARELLGTKNARNNLTDRK